MYLPTDILSIESWILLLALIASIRLYFHQKWKVLKSWNIPHNPPSLLKLGNSKSVYRHGVLPYSFECKKRFGQIWGYYTLTMPRIVVHDVEILRHICIKEFSNFTNRLEHGQLLDGKEIASGLLSAVDDNWKRSRKTLAPTFSTSKLKQMSGIMGSCVRNTLKVLEKVVENNNGIFVTKCLFNKLSLDVISATSFSTDVNSQDPTRDEPEISKQVREFFDRGFIGMANFVVMEFPLLEPLFVWLGGMQKNVVYFRNLCQGILQRKNDDTDQTCRVDLMRLMIQTKISNSDARKGTTKGLTTSEIIGNAIVMLLAGYETTSSAMTYLAYNLAFHPDIQQKLQAEIDELYRGKETPSIDAINDLKFLDMCVHESLRLYSPLPRTFRTAKNSITIRGLNIPKGCTVIIPIFSLNHDPEHWNNPMDFRPERMKNHAEIDPVIFQPFGTGPGIPGTGIVLGRDLPLWKSK